MRSNRATSHSSGMPSPFVQRSSREQKYTVRGHFGTISYRAELKENSKTVQTKPGLIKTILLRLIGTTAVLGVLVRGENQLLNFNVFANFRVGNMHIHSFTPPPVSRMSQYMSLTDQNVNFASLQKNNQG